jgi:hypothetical protein
MSQHSLSHAQPPSQIACESVAQTEIANQQQNEPPQMIQIDLRRLSVSRQLLELLCRVAQVLSRILTNLVHAPLTAHENGAA